MRPAIGRILAVDKGEEGLAIAAVAVGKTKLQRLIGVMERRINRLAVVGLQLFHHQIEQTVAGLEDLPVINQLQARIQIAVMAQPPFDVLRLEQDFFENSGVWFEADERPVRFVGRFAALFVLQLALFERAFDVFPGAIAAHQELLGQGIDRFGAHPVQPDAELEHIVVVLGPGVNLRDTIDHLSQRDAAAKISHRHGAALDVDLHFLAVAHDILVDRVIDHLLEQDVTAVIVMRAIANPADIHSRPQPDMLQRGEGLDFAFVVNVLLGLCHICHSILKGTARFANR